MRPVFPRVAFHVVHPDIRRPEAVFLLIEVALFQGIRPLCTSGVYLCSVPLIHPRLFSYIPGLRQAMNVARRMPNRRAISLTLMPRRLSPMALGNFFGFFLLHCKYPLILAC